MNSIYFNCLLLFVSTYFLVLFLGLQSLNVNGGHRRMAFLTSIGIGIANLVVLKLAPNASLIETIAFLAGGPFGIIHSMDLHKYLKERKQKNAIKGS